MKGPDKHKYIYIYIEKMKKAESIQAYNITWWNKILKGISQI